MRRSGPKQYLLVRDMHFTAKIDNSFEMSKSIVGYLAHV